MLATDYAETINRLAKECAEATEANGFNLFDRLEQTITKLALITSEVSEALAVLRDVYDFDGSAQEADFTEELADIVIRTLDLAGYVQVDLGQAIVDKMAKNKTRPYRHGKQF